MTPFDLTLLRSCLALVLATVSLVAVGQELPKDSPFLPPAASAGSTAATQKYQLAGMIVMGKEIMISVTRLSDKQSFWIPIGGTVNEVTAVSYNPDQDEARIRVQGENLTLPLRKPVVQSSGPAASSAANLTAAGVAPAPVISPPLPSLASAPPEVQEREARMLVTDLLDIGQQQRKAYEEAQKKAAAEKK